MSVIDLFRVAPKINAIEMKHRKMQIFKKQIHNRGSTRRRPREEVVNSLRRIGQIINQIIMHKQVSRK